MNKNKPQLFNADLVTLRALFTNEYNPTDRAKNYYIPLYQREYNWERKSIIKLFDDIYELYQDNVDFQPYFLGGFVFSRESMEGEVRTSMSLEIIDGQQRLMTLSILIACIIQSLKFEKRKFIGKKDYIDSLIDNLTNYTITKRFDDNYKISIALKIERSDQLKDLYEKIIKNLINERIIYSDYKSIKEINDENKSFVNNVQALHRKIRNLDDDELLQFIIQLLDHTQVVVTKTDSFETGYLVFEKLNDSGKQLHAHDLLKNFLFRVTSEKENLELKNGWEEFINTIEEIDPKISPKLFFEYYLISIGYEYNSSSTSHLFLAYREYFEKNNTKELLILNDMIDSVKKFKELKESFYANITLNQMDFKLGFILLLSFYNKFRTEFINNEKVIFNLIFRFGYVYLLTEKIKPIKKIIKSLCKDIYVSTEDIDSTINNIRIKINNLINEEKTSFKNQLLDNDRYRKEQYTKLLFQLINIHSMYTPFDNNFIVERIMPIDYTLVNYDFEEIDNDNAPKYANLIGNLAIYNNDKNLNNLDFNERINEIAKNETVIVNYVLNCENKIEDIANDNYIRLLKEYNNSKQWSKNIIQKRTESFVKIATELFINDKININLLFKEN